MFDKSIRFKQVCQLLLSPIVGNHTLANAHVTPGKCLLYYLWFLLKTILINNILKIKRLKYPRNTMN